MFGLSNLVLFTKMEKTEGGTGLGGHIKSCVVNLVGLTWLLDAKVELSGRQLDVCIWALQEWILEIEVGESESTRVVIRAQAWMRSLRR